MTPIIDSASAGKNLLCNWWARLDQLNRLNWLILDSDSAVIADIRCDQCSHTRNDDKRHSFLHFWQIYIRVLTALNASESLISLH